MEKVLSADERIRRAEEIYYGKMNKDIKKVQPIYKREQKRKGSLLLKILIVLIIIISVYAYQNCTYIFSEQFLTDINNLKIKQKLEDAFNYIKDNFLLDTVNTTNEVIENNQEEDRIEQNLATMMEDTLAAYVEVNNVESNNIESNEVLNIDRDALDLQNVEDIQIDNAEKSQEEPIENDLSNLSEMEIDAKVVKENYSLIVPLQGQITSEFGHRTSEYKNVTSYHTGIDIAQNIGADIISSMDGNVVLVSSQGDYGNHIKIESGEVLTLYAHCSRILVAEGDEVKQGQKIAEVRKYRKCYWTTLTF